MSERPPGHFVCWCGKVVHEGFGSHTLYETNGDLHECEYLASPAPTPEREAEVWKVYPPDGDGWWTTCEQRFAKEWAERGCTVVPLYPGSALAARQPEASPEEAT